MGNKRVGLARTQALLQALKRDLNLVDTTLTNCTITTDQSCTFSSELVASGGAKITGVIEKSIEEKNNTSSAIDISSKNFNHTVVLTGAFASDLKLPLATAARHGLVIRVLFAADCATAGMKIGVANSGSTVIDGLVRLSSDDTKNVTDAVSVSSIQASAKVLNFDSDAADECGGRAGTVCTFTYQGTNKIFCEVEGLTSDNTPEVDTAAFSGTGL